MPLTVAVVEDDPESRACIVRALGCDRDCVLSSAANNIDTLADADIGIINLDELTHSALAWIRHAGLASRGPVIWISQDPVRIAELKHDNEIVLCKPLSASAVMAAVTAAKSVVLLRKMEELSRMFVAVQEASPADPALPNSQDIEWVEADRNYITVHTNRGTFSVRMTISEAENKLRHTAIVRAHRRWLVNLDKVQRLTTDGAGATSVETSTGKALHVSRPYRRSIRQQLRQIAHLNH